MDRKKLERIRDDIAAARRKSQKQSDLADIATRLGRYRGKKSNKRGKEPAWVSPLPGLHPVSIPNAKRGDIKPGTKAQILDNLEDDLAAWEKVLQEREHGE